MATLANIAASYVAAGWVPIRIRAGTKQPIGKEWQLHPPTPDQFGEGDGIGVLLGQAGNHRADVDLDCEIAMQLAPSFLPETKCISGHASNPRSHHWFICEPAPQYLSFSGTDGKKLLELRCGFGQQTLVPPSLHPDGEPYIWYEQAAPAVVEGAMLQQHCRRLAAAVLLAKHYPGEGSRHDLALSLSGFLLRNGWAEEDAVHLVTAVARTAGDDELEDRKDCVHTTQKRIASGENTTGGIELRKILGKEVMDKMSDWLGIDGQRARATIQEADWPEPLPLTSALKPVDKFDLGFLAESLRPLVADVAERTQTPIDFAGITAMIGLAATTGRRAIMSPLAFDASWQLPLNLWALICARPGALKSAIVNAVTQPLRAIEAGWRQEYEHALSVYQLVHEQQELTRQNQREQYKKALKQSLSDSAEPLSLAEESEPPVQKRLLASDCTFEKMHEILRDNPAGICTLRDELVSWLSELDKRGRESERGFYLQGWAGDTSFTVDRIGRGSIFVPHVCISLLGCLQPARLRAYLSDAFSHSCGPLGDGLLARFQLATWPDDPSDWTQVDRPPDVQALTTVERIFSRLAHLSPENPVRLGFDADAQACFDVWRAKLEKAISDSDMPEALISHLSKYRSLVPKLSALGTLADAAARNDFAPGPEVMPVNLPHIEQAITFCDYAWTHALRIYESCNGAAGADAGRKLAKQIEAGKLPATISVREIYRHHWYGLETPEKARAALRHLADLGWVREVEPDREKGRPSELWEINPACRKKGGEQ